MFMPKVQNLGSPLCAKVVMNLCILVPATDLCQVHAWIESLKNYAFFAPVAILVRELICQG